MKRISTHFTGLFTLVLIPSLAMLAIWTLGGCSTLSRSPASGYYGSIEEVDSFSDRLLMEKAGARGEIGTWGDLDEDDLDEAVNLRMALRKAEKHIQGHRERDQYFKIGPYLNNDRERLKFLSLGSYEARERWLTRNKIDLSSIQHPPEVQSMIKRNDVSLGMTKEAVRDSWGEPETIEIAGNPIYGNERWYYTEQIPSTEGFRTEERLIYFESGRVAGWEKR
jgi:hypothetical protein